MILFAVAATMSLVSCVNDILNVEENQAETPKVHLTFSASYNDDTKTQLVNGTDVWWNPYDVISVNGEYFWSTNEEPSPSADFEGEIAQADIYHAIYPAWNVWEWGVDGNVALVDVREGQNAVNGTFDNEVNVSAARTTADDLNLRFHNLLGYAAITIANDDSHLRKLTVRSRAGESLSGYCALNWEGDSPTLKILEDYGGNSSVYLDFDEDDKSGTYYIAMLPGTYSEGLTFRFEDDQERYAMLEIKGSLTMEAGQIKNLGTVDNLNFKEDHQMQLARQENALYEIYNMCGGDSSNWFSDAPLDEWDGIETDEMGYVTSIDLSSYNISGYLSLNCASDFKRLQNFKMNGVVLTSNNGSGYLSSSRTADIKLMGSADSNGNEVTVEFIDIKGNGLLEKALFSGFSVVDFRIENIDEVELDNCDGIHYMSGECISLSLKNCAFAQGGSAGGMTAVDAYVYNCQMESCGISSNTLVFEESSTYDTWYANTEERLEIINSYCSTICSGDFRDETDIILENATLWRSNWNEYSLKTLTCTIKGKDWNGLFDDESDYVDSEQTVLMHLFHNANGSEWLDNTNWGSDKPLGEWYGVETDSEGYVTAIDLHGNGLSAEVLSLNLLPFSRLTRINIDDNAFGHIMIKGNGKMEELVLNQCAYESISVEDIADVTIMDCDSLSSIGGSCKELLVKDCEFKYGASTPFEINVENAHILGCSMHSCGLSSDVLVFEESSTYDTWHCVTSSRLEIINSYCSTICGWDFDEDADLILENATLWRSNWDEESFVTFTCSIKGSQWYDLF